jgi:molybdenum cofactor biosynthesis enzyme MoaA
MIKPRIDLQNRTNLETVIPLSTPYVLYVDPSSICNFQCKFCYQSDKKCRKDLNPKLLSYKLFQKIVEDCKEFDQKIKILRLYGFGEPLIHPNFSSMVKLALDNEICEKVDTTTNASHLNEKLSKDLINSGISRINISIEGINEQQYKTFSNFEMKSMKEFINNISYLYKIRNNCEIIIKINGDILSEEDKEKFKTIFEPISDGIFIESIMSCWSDFEVDVIWSTSTKGSSLSLYFL